MKLPNFSGQSKKLMAYPYQIQSYEAYQKAWQQSLSDPEGFWGGIAEHFTWRKKWARVWDEVKYCSDRCRNKR